jgi:2-hydroxycyclohexanecarboxyl-CoA dehydrogenase
MTVSDMTHVAVVTGGASGIGLSCARQLAEAGRKVAIWDRDGDLAAKQAAEMQDQGLDVIGQAVDVVDRDNIEAALGEIRSTLGPITIIVTSAGVTGMTPFADLTLDEWDHVIRVNLTGTFESIQAVVPDMIEAGWGRIVTIASSSAQSGAPQMAHYAASKGAVFALTKSLAVELGRHGITANSIPPRTIDTPMLRNSPAFRGRVDEGLAAVAARNAVGRAGTPDDIAAACTFLCSDAAGYITGQIIGVNGGGYI